MWRSSLSGMQSTAGPRQKTAFAAPEQPPSVLAANVEAGLTKRQAGELGAPEGSVGCHATKIAGRLSLEALPHHQGLLIVV